MDEIVFCPKCAWIGHSYDKMKDRANYRICCECHTPLIGTGIPVSEDPIVLTPEWFEFNRKIYKEMIEPLGQLDESLPIFQSHYNEYFGDYEEEYRKTNEILEMVYAKKKENQPHCPICGSTNIKKISTGNKVGSAALFGVFSLGHISKTFKCNNCGMKF